MNDILENVLLLAALMFAGVGATVTVLIMMVKAMDFFENGMED